MRNIFRISLILLTVVGGIFFTSCSQKTTQTGLLQGGVTIGPITPVQTPGQVVIVPPEVFSSRKVLVYDASGAKLLQSVTINQIGQTANGYYSVELAPGTYTIDVTRTGGVGGSSDVPKKIQIVAGQTVTLDINIDTGIR
ncbi:MAG: hypothetical protein ABR886_12710 [Dehalococcoidales bacterium]|jgi:hypothetical protein